jgi:hypothetical protein
MIGMRTFALVVVCATLGVGRVSAQERVPQYQFRVWQFLPDSSRTSPGGMSGVVSGDEDFHMYIALGAGRTPPVRLDGDFVAHQVNDSTLLVGDITAIRILSRDSTRLFARDLESEEQLERRTYRLRATIARGGPVWFYPFGVPRRGERGVAFELTSSISVLAQSTSRDTTRYVPPPGFAPMEYGINGLKRPHRARLRIEIGDTAFVTLFEGEALTRIPMRIRLERGARGQDLMFELEAEERPGAALCWRWFWMDEQPPGGSACGHVSGKAIAQSLYGSGGLKMRVTLLSPR